MYGWAVRLSETTRSGDKYAATHLYPTELQSCSCLVESIAVHLQLDEAEKAGAASSRVAVAVYLSKLRGRSVAPPLRIWRLHIVTEPELKCENEGVVR